MLLFYLVFEGQGEGWWQNISSENEIIFVTQKIRKSLTSGLDMVPFLLLPITSGRASLGGGGSSLFVCLGGEEWRGKDGRKW